jgi:hypothetical protein
VGRAGRPNLRFSFIESEKSLRDLGEKCALLEYFFFTCGGNCSIRNIGCEWFLVLNPPASGRWFVILNRGLRFGFR